MIVEEYSPERIEQITRNIDLAFDFLDGVLERPEVLEHLPREGEIDLRAVDVRGHVYLLLAVQPPDEATWTAYVVRSTPTAGASAAKPPVLDDLGEIHDQGALVRRLTATEATAAAALDALEHDLRTRFEDGIGIPATTGQRSAD